MSRGFFITCITAGFFITSPVYAWRPCEAIGKCVDVIGAVSKPFEGRLCEKLGLPCVDVIDGVKHALTEAQVQTVAPLFAEWLRASRNTSRNNSYSIPENIKQGLSGFYGEDILGSVTYKIGDNGVANLGGLSIKYGDARAVTLIDVIVFKDEYDVNDPELWAHELRHVEQFNKGVNDFAIRYLRELRHEHNPLENDARNAEARYQQWKAQQAQYQGSGRQARNHWPNQPQTGMNQNYSIPAQVCSTPYGGCQMQVAVPIGTPCFCQSYNGPINGIAR